MTNSAFNFDNRIDFRYSDDRDFDNVTVEYELLDELVDDAWENYLDIHAQNWVTIEYDLFTDTFTVRSCTNSKC